MSRDRRSDGLDEMTTRPGQPMRVTIQCPLLDGRRLAYWAALAALNCREMCFGMGAAVLEREKTRQPCRLAGYVNWLLADCYQHVRLWRQP